MIQQFDLVEVDDRIGHKQRTGLRHAISAPADLLVAEQSSQLSARGKRRNGIPFRLYAKPFCILRDELHGAANIVQRCIVRCVQKRPIPQHKYGITHRMQLAGSRAALFHFRSDGAAVARQHHCIAPARSFRRVIKQLHHAQRRIFRNFFRSVHLPCDLYALIVVFDYKVHRIRTLIDQLRLCILGQRFIIPVIAFDGQHFPAISIVSGCFQRRVLPQFPHGGLRCDIGLAQLCRKCRLCQQEQESQTQQHRTKSFFHSNPLFLPVIYTVPPRTRRPA